MQIKIKHYNNRLLINSFKATLFSKNKHIPLYSAFFLLSMITFCIKYEVTRFLTIQSFNKTCQFLKHSHSSTSNIFPKNPITKLSIVPPPRSPLMILFRYQNKLPVGYTHNRQGLLPQ